MKTIIKLNKTLFSILLCLAMCVGIVLLPVDANAATRFPSNGEVVNFTTDFTDCIGADHATAHTEIISCQDGNGWIKDIYISYSNYPSDDRVYLLRWQPDDSKYDGDSMKSNLDELLTHLKGLSIDQINELINNGCCVKWYSDPTPTSAPSSTHVHSWTHGVIYEATETSDGLEGDICSCGAVQNTSPISAYGYACNVAETKLNNYKQVPQGSDFVLDMGRWNSFPRKYMEAIASRSDVNITLKIEYKNKKYELYIPAGTKIDTSCEWYGPLKLMSMFEYKQLN